MDRRVDTGNKRWFVWLGLLATGITLFVFITGKNLPDLFGSNNATAPVEEVEAGNPVTEYFPLFVGSVRTYTVGRSTRLEDQGDLVEKVSTFTEQVILVESGAHEWLHIYKVEQRGGILDLECTVFEPVEGKVNKWYVTDETSLYVACSEEEKNRIAGALYARHIENATPDADTPLPKIVFPLEVGNRWPAFEGMPPPGPDEDYQWRVESQEPIETAAGKFNDCFTIVLYTLPDASYRHICKGIGVVALEYHHMGTAIDYRVELSSYSLSGNP